MATGGTFPTSPAPSGIAVRSIAPSLLSVAHSLKRQVRTRGGQRWGAKLSWGPQLKAAMMPIMAFCMAQRGQFGAFQIVLPTPFDTPQGSWAGAAPRVDGASQVGNVINLKNFTPSQSGVIKAGDVFKFSDSKIYMALADANSDGAGKVASLAIEPKLIVSPADNEALTYTAVPFTMMLNGDLIEVPAEPPALFSYALDLMEAY